MASQKGTKASNGVTAADDLTNTRYVGDGLTIKRGDRATPVFLPVTFRAIEETMSEPGRERTIPRFVSLMFDKRAPGVWAGMVGGPKSKVEHLAELAVRHDVVADIAGHFADVTLMRKVSDSLLRANQRWKNGILTIDYPALLRAVSRAIGASSSRADSTYAVARIITELLSRAYTKLNVMVPFVGAADFSMHNRPVARLDDILVAEQVATVTEVFEAIELGNAFDASKEFNPAVTEALIGPLLTTAANRLMNCLKYRKYMRDAATLTGRYLANPSLLPEHLQEHPDLQYLSTNASFALGAIARANTAVTTPDFDLEAALAYTVMRLREMRRFETISMEKFASFYSIELERAKSGYIAGVFVARHDPFKVNTQVTRFVDRSDIVAQLPSDMAEALISPLAEAVNNAFSGARLVAAASVAAQYQIVSAWELDGTEVGGYGMAYNMTNDELEMLSLAHSQFITIGGITDDGTINPIVYRTVPDLKMFYNARGLPTGAGFITTDPFEVLILNGVEKSDAAPFMLKPQVIMDETRRVVLSDMPEFLDEDGMPVRFLSQLSKPVRIALPLLGQEEVARSESLLELLGISEIGELHLTIDAAAARALNCSFATMIAAYYDVQSNAEGGRFIGRQIATALHEMVGDLAMNGAFIKLLQTMNTRFVLSPEFAGRHRALRAHLQEAFVRHSLSLNVAFMILLKLGILEFGVHEDLMRIFEAEDVVEVAITSETWQKALNAKA